MNGTCRIGTSGWSYKHWLEIFYPRKLPSRRWLPFFAKHFDTVEINSTFYHLPRESAVQGWYEATPANFIFALKLSRFITHQKKLRNVEEPLDRFLERIAPLQEKTGPILIQLPPGMPFRAEVASDFFELMRQKLPQQRLAVEPRNVSWFEAPAMELYQHFSIALCFADSGEVFPHRERVTSDWIYLRFHGRNGLYQGNYTEDLLLPFAKKMAAWLRSGLDVYAYFNNDISGFAVFNAKLLRELVQRELNRRP